MIKELKIYLTLLKIMGDAQNINRLRKTHQKRLKILCGT